MAFERMSANQLDKWDARAKEVMTKKADETIKSHSIYAAIVFALPMWGLETFIYFFILWGMYKTIAQEMHGKFGISDIIGGVIINVMICIVINMIADFVVLFGWIGSAIIGYIATYQSGRSYLGLLAGKKG